MNRRDTIIIAVLVNAGLLMVLFATAMRSDKAPTATKSSMTSLAEASSAIPEPLAPPPSLPPAMGADSIDQILNQYVAIPALAEEVPIEENVPSADEIVAAPTNISPQPTYVAPAVSQPQQVNSSIPANTYAQVVVKKGDALEKIARAHGTSVAAIMKANQLTSTQLKIGQVLKVPSKEGTASSSPAKAERPSITDEYYIVKEGDSPWVIANRNNLKLEELLRLNNLDEQSARRLRPGNKLRIR